VLHKTHFEVAVKVTLCRHGRSLDFAIGRGLDRVFEMEHI
jgi:hypothetical protein